MPKDPPKMLYQIIKEDILSRIENQQFSYDEPICTEKSLSEQYGVSRITSKRAIDDLEKEGILYRKRGVGSFVRREPGPALEDQKAELDPALPEAVEGITIPLVLPFAVTLGGMMRTVEAAARELASHGYHLAIHICEHDPDKGRNLLLHLYAQHAAGLIFYPAGKELHADILKMFTDSGRRVIILDKPHAIDYLSSVVCDHYGGSYMLTSHLISYGHRKIAYLSRNSPEEMSSLSARFKGFMQCMKDNGLTVDPEHVKVNASMDYHMLKHIINSLYRSGVTAIECENDEVAFHVHMCCLGLSIQVPEQMNITGFDNIEWAVTGNAQITTIDQNFPAIGEAIARLILEPGSKPVIQTIPVELVPRASTGPC
ncbi:GntR family transcriptional regulator [Paenibacillus sp. GCM10012307]|uniref:GntR family transcriptional regulator n=1 Tax=Paenibacillus roseus TaxID=2798579 RepID=A0A934MTK2_9BACL|nr:GntR family transcriptional regulator [Paenibacillus roseus]MBJ6364299.1 GntR family transcriptional regulator [Paenibacillus roseus]